MEGLVYTDGEVTNTPGQGGGQKPQGGPMGDNSGDAGNLDNSDRPTLSRRQGRTVRNSRMIYIITRMRNPYSRSGFLLRL